MQRRRYLEAAIVLPVVLLLGVAGLMVQHARSKQLAPIIQETSISLQLVDLIPEIMDSVVHVQCPDWQGSGFVVSDHLIATARHVVDGVGDFTITFNDGSTAQADRALSSKNWDVAFIWVDQEIVAPPVKLGSIEDCKLGDPVVVIGSSYGLTNFNCVSTGIVSGLDRNWDSIDPYTGEAYGWEWGFTADASGAPGNSGCPLFDLNGVVRGILVGGYDSTHVFFMPADLFLSDIEKIEAAFEIAEEYEFEEMAEYQKDHY